VDIFLLAIPAFSMETCKGSKLPTQMIKNVCGREKRGTELITFFIIEVKMKIFN